MRPILAAILLSLAAGAGAPAAAQYSDRYEFFQAVRKGNATDAIDILTKPGSNAALMKEKDTGLTGLHIATQNGEPGWINLMQKHGADMNAQDDEGNTALMLAANARWTDGLRLLIYHGANVNLANRRGETPLIRAVQLRDLDSMRVLLESGADPDQPDSFAGLSARDYAERDRRGNQVRAMLEAHEARTEAVGEVQGPDL